MKIHAEVFASTMMQILHLEIRTYRYLENFVTPVTWIWFQNIQDVHVVMIHSGTVGDNGLLV